MTTKSPAQQLVPPPPSRRTKQDDESEWCKYRDEWKKYPQQCRNHWKQHNLPAARIGCWASLSQAYQAYIQATKSEEMTPWRSLAAAFDAYIKAKAENAENLASPAWLEYFRIWLEYRHAWCLHWAELGQPWRFEPEIAEKRKEYLKQRLKLPPDIQQGIYPFRIQEAGKPIKEGKRIRLTRADIEWLLATHIVTDANEDKVNWLVILSVWSPIRPGQPNRGLDLRGANLEDADLHKLPLTELHGGLSGEEWQNTKSEQRTAAAIQLKKANLHRTCLRAAALRGANLEGADLHTASLEQVALRRANLSNANLCSVFLDHATSLAEVILDEKTCLADVSWDGVNLAEVENWPEMLGDETKAHKLEEDNRSQKKEDTLKAYQDAVSAYHQLSIALRDQGLNSASDRYAYRAEKNYRYVLGLISLKHFQKNILWFLLAALIDLLAIGTIVWVFLGAMLFRVEILPLPVVVQFAENFAARLGVVSLIGLLLSALLLVSLFIFKPLIRLTVFFGLNMVTCIAFISTLIWIIFFIVQNPSELTLIIPIIFIVVLFWKITKKICQNIWQVICLYINAQIDFGRYLFSWFLDILVGYGYKPIRGFLNYLFVVTIFAAVYYVLGQTMQSVIAPFSLLGAFVFSVTSFHGRGFFPGPPHPGINYVPIDNSVIVLAALEAAIGLLIEVSFIATFTQRFFGK